MSTMTSDVAQMNLNPFDVLDFDSYEDGKPTTGKSYAPPVEGRYTGRVLAINDNGTDVFSTDNSFGRTAEGYLKVQLDPIELLDGSGYQVRFTKLSTKKYAKRNGSQVLDFLRACGIDARPKSEAELRAAVRTAVGRPFLFQLVWEAYNKDTQEEIKGMDSFPVDPSDSTKRLPYVKDQYDPSKRWFANGKIRYFVSALSNKQ